MQKRRERIERWRAERKKKELEVTKKEIKGSLLGLYSFSKWAVVCNIFCVLTLT
jgi:ATP-dependent RNA helicase DDX46/PRP5